MSQKIQAIAEHKFEASAEQVYDAWLNPLYIREWMKAALQRMGLPGEIGTVNVDATLGGKFEFSDMRASGEAKHWGTYLRLNRPNEIVFTWIVDESEEADPSVVTLSIKSTGNGCVAKIIHEMDAAWKDYLDRTEAAWTNMLQSVDSCLVS